MGLYDLNNSWGLGTGTEEWEEGAAVESVKTKDSSVFESALPL